MAEAPRSPADSPTGPAAGGRIVVELVRGLAGTTRYQREVVRGLGLRRLGAVADRPDTPMIRGMVARVPHLVRIVSPEEAPQEVPPPSAAPPGNGGPGR